MVAVEAEERRNKGKQIAALDKKREHVSDPGWLQL
jgi:hypothetical protein